MLKSKRDIIRLELQGLYSYTLTDTDIIKRLSAGVYEVITATDSFIIYL